MQFHIKHHHKITKEKMMENGSWILLNYVLFKDKSIELTDFDICMKTTNPGMLPNS